MSKTRIKSCEVRLVRALLKRPFVTALGRRTETVNAAIAVRLGDGSEGYGEASSSLALAHLTPARLAGDLRALGRMAEGHDARDARLLADQAWERRGHAPPAAAAFECALLEALAASAGLSLRAWLGGKLASVESDVTLSAVSAAEVAEAAAEAAALGYRLLKLKLGPEARANAGRLKAVRAACPGARLILDGNQGLDLRGALHEADLALKLGLKAVLFEQPLPKTDLKGLAALRRRSPIPVAVDESVMTPADAVAVADAEAADVINIKLAKSGIFRALEIAAVAKAAGMGLMIGCMMETAAGLSASAALAMGTGFFGHVDLDSDVLLEEGGPKARGWRRDGPRLRAD